MTPEGAQRFLKKGFLVFLEEGYGQNCQLKGDDFPKQVQWFKDWPDSVGSDKKVFLLQVDLDSVPKKKIAKLAANWQIITAFCNNPEPIKVRDLYILSRLPRTTRAQVMDVLSSQNNLWGYRAVLEGACLLPKVFPNFMTSAGNIKPAKVLIIGVGVAGLQAIATAARLGAEVYAHDLRPETQEQVVSLGATFLNWNGVQDQLNEFDLIITTALVLGKKAPLILTAKDLAKLKKGSLVIDLAAGNGGNTELTELDEMIEKNGVRILGKINYAEELALESSNLLTRNLWNFVELLLKNPEDTLAQSIKEKGA